MVTFFFFLVVSDKELFSVSYLRMLWNVFLIAAHGSVSMMNHSDEEIFINQNVKISYKEEKKNSSTQQ